MIRNSVGHAVIAVVLLAAGQLAHAEPAAGAASQAKRGVTVEIPPAGVVQEAVLKDGSRLYGRVVRIDGEGIHFQTVGGVSVVLAEADIIGLKHVRGRIVDGEFVPSSSVGTRLFFAPTARTLSRGEGYFGVYEVFLPFVQVGVTDRLSVGGGTPLLFGGGDERPFWFTPKLQITSSETVQTAVGVIHVAGLDEPLGIAYGVATFGRSDSAVTVGVGYGYSDDGRAPIIMAGGERRVSRRVALMTENWLWRGGHGFISAGVRFLGDRLSADVGLLVPLEEGGDLFAFPLVNFVWRF